MEKENKKRGFMRIFNVFDLVLIAVAVLLAAALVIPRLGGSGEDTPAPLPLSSGTVQVRYVLEVTVSDEYRDAAKAGMNVVDKIQHYDLGTVESVEVRDAVRRITDYENGRVVNAAVPGQVTMLVTVVGRAAVSGTKILLDEGFLIRVGTGVNGMYGDVNLYGTVVSIDRGTVA